MAKKLKREPVLPVEYNEKGYPIFNLSATVSNANWMAAKRLRDSKNKKDREKFDKMDNTRMVKIKEEKQA